MRIAEGAGKVFLWINAFILACFTGLIMFLRNFYYKDAQSISAFEKILKGRQDAGAIRFFLSSYYIFIILIIALIVVNRLIKTKRTTFVINSIFFVLLIILTPLILSWFLFLMPIFQCPVQ